MRVMNNPTPEELATYVRGCSFLIRSMTERPDEEIPDPDDLACAGVVLADVLEDIAKVLETKRGFIEANNV